MKVLISTKRELHCHHLELGIDLENMELDVALLEEEEGEQEEERGEEREEREMGENDGDQKRSLFSLTICK